MVDPWHLMFQQVSFVHPVQFQAFLQVPQSIWVPVPHSFSMDSHGGWCWWPHASSLVRAAARLEYILASYGSDHNHPGSDQSSQVVLSQLKKNEKNMVKFTISFQNEGKIHNVSTHQLALIVGYCSPVSFDHRNSTSLTRVSHKACNELQWRDKQLPLISIVVKRWPVGAIDQMTLMTYFRSGCW